MAKSMEARPRTNLSNDSGDLPPQSNGKSSWGYIKHGMPCMGNHEKMINHNEYNTTNHITILLHMLGSNKNLEGSRTWRSTKTSHTHRKSY